MSVIDNVTSESNDGDKPVEEATNPLDQLVGEGKRYADSEALAKGRIEADRYIKQLESENKEMRDTITEAEQKVQRAATVDELLAEVRKNAGSTEGESPVSEADIQTIVGNVLSKEKQAEQAKRNRAAVNAAITEAYPDPAKAEAFVLAKTQQLGLGKEEIARLSDTTPAAFLAMLGLLPDKSKEASPSFYDKSKVNTVTMNQNSDGVRNMSYYNRLRKEMGMAKFFNDKNLQAQKFKDAQELGEAFYQ